MILIWQLCHPHWAFKLLLRTFIGKLPIFLILKSTTIGFLLGQTQQFAPVLFENIPRVTEKDLLSSHYAGYLEVAGTWYTTWCM